MITKTDYNSHSEPAYTETALCRQVYFKICYNLNWDSDTSSEW